MSEELAVVTQEDLAALPSINEEAIANVIDSGFERIPYIKLVTPQSTALIARGFPANNYGLFAGEDEPDVLGPNVSVLPLHCKPMALDTSEPESTYVIFDTSNPHFERIVSESNKPGDTQNYMHGVNFMIWLPEQEKLVTMFFGTKSARRVAPTMKAQLRKMATLGSKLIETAKYSWYVPKVTASDASMPELDMARISEAVQTFVDAPDWVPGQVDEDAIDEHSDEDRAR